jgi:hypothetical protein
MAHTVSAVREHNQSQHSGSGRTKRQLSPEPVVTKSKSEECNGRRNEAQMRRGSAKARRYGTQMATKWFGPIATIMNEWRQDKLGEQ